MTNNLPSVESVTSGLSSTSEKIIALAHAGYTRSEISKILDIRYQRVRRVLLDAGITTGLSRSVDFEREPVTAAVSAEQRTPTSAQVLLKAGFRTLGEWHLVADGELVLTANAPKDAGVYAFVVDGWIRYIGLTQTGLRTRMGHYRRGHKRHRTSARVKVLIATSLAQRKVVSVLVATPEPLQWNGLPVNTAAGLEAGLIRMIRPDWNMLGARASLGDAIR